MIPAGKYACAVVICIYATTIACAQTADSASVFSRPITLDTFTIKSGFDVNAFIRRVKNDTTFYKAFRSTHLIAYTAKNNINIFGNNHGELVASDYSITKQERNDKCRQTKVLEEKTTGDFYKRNGEYNYYTAALFASLFYAREPVCDEDDIVTGKLIDDGQGGMEKRKYELKQLIFNPGSKISGIPFMADRVSIFDPGEAEKYDFSVTLETYNSQPCYVFRIKPRAGYERKTLYNDLTTWFRKSDYSILARDYALAYHTLFYDFDVVMKIRTTQINGKLYPSYIDYNGNWHIFTKKRERAKFTVDITY